MWFPVATYVVLKHRVATAPELADNLRTSHDAFKPLLRHASPRPLKHATMCNLDAMRHHLQLNADILDNNCGSTFIRQGPVPRPDHHCKNVCKTNGIPRFVSIEVLQRELCFGRFVR